MHPGFPQIRRNYPPLSPEIVAHKCGIPIDDSEKAARYWAESKRVLSLWSMGINQSSEGTAKARTLINLHLMTANIGKPGAGPFSLTGQPNAMGGREAGGLCHLLPGYRSVNNPQHRPKWNKLGVYLLVGFLRPRSQCLEYDYWFGDGRCQTSLDCRY
jgi:ferredoxin-nitrate reductase